MKRVLPLLLVAVAASLLAPGRAASDPAWAGECGIQAQQTVWGDYGWPTLLPILAQPGTLLAVTQHPGNDYSAEARARGAATYSFDLKLKNKVGTPSAPADPSTIAAAATAEYQLSVGRTTCSTPLIVENELFGASAPTPWATATAQYRANVLAFLTALAAQGAHPVLLINSTPYTSSSDAVAWWLAVAKVASIVRESYVPATSVWPLGPVLGNRFLRERYRAAVAPFSAMGIPASRLGIMLSFLSQKGVGGRNGLEPSSAWFQVVKWEALSAKEVAAELHLGSVFSWGWQQWNAAEEDPDKPDAACVWLWARSQSLCDAPKMLGSDFDSSLTEGQIILPRGKLCEVPGLGTIGVHQVKAIEAVTGDPDAALSLAFERLVESGQAQVTRRAVLAAERAVIASSFGGSRTAYLTALRQAHVGLGAARAVLADELRRAQLEEKLPVPALPATDVAAFYTAYPTLLVRSVRVSPAAPWLGGAKRGLALEEAAPEQLFSLATGRKTQVTTLSGTYSVRPLAAPQPLGSLALSRARPAIVAALRGFARAQAFEQWTIAKQTVALASTICVRDQLPQPAAIDLTEYLPFLRLS